MSVTGVEYMVRRNVEIGGEVARPVKDFIGDTLFTCGEGELLIEL